MPLNALSIINAALNIKNTQKKRASKYFLARLNVNNNINIIL